MHGVDDDHAGVKPEITEFCYQLGVNVIFYAHAEYTKWLSSRMKKSRVTSLAH